MFYIYSFIITLILFIIIQLIEKNKNEKEYVLFTLNNVLIFVILFIISSIILYYVIGNEAINLNIFDFNFKGGSAASASSLNEINPEILTQIPDKVNVGFEPYDD
jgi:hypothetical protein